MTRRFGMLMVAAALTAGVASPVFSQDAMSLTLASAQFPYRMDSPAGPIELKGAGIARVAKLIKICAAALYAPAEVSARSANDVNAPRRLEIEYFVGVSRERFIQLANKTLQQQLSAAELAAIGDRVEALHRLYRDVERGDRYALTYRPGRGLCLELNGQELGWIEGADFARAYLGIWLGDAALSEPLRKQLVGRG